MVGGRNIEFYKNIFTTYIDMIDSNEISWDNTINDALRRLSSYYRHQIDLLKGYETNQDKVIEQTKIITGWVNNIGKLIEEMSKLKS
ncbi:hypothetical protein SH1V18_44360 [Vallitalea longa]|uniref:Uncharacterized protein n=1 Tax=Vallitalea longa TaxID=2936439 RepID=A0A9W5YFZ3_9FIRM|nr:hypothetical protein [Vallitalea longa]GKX31956.1 hypothetical protein SH1V18_44360 [Vallitalea longa]